MLDIPGTYSMALLGGWWCSVAAATAAVAAEKLLAALLPVLQGCHIQLQDPALLHHTFPRAARNTCSPCTRDII